MKGTTLIELMLALFISTLILSSVIEIYLATHSISQTQSALSSIILNSHTTFNFIKTALKTGNQVIVQSYHDIKMKPDSMGFRVSNSYFISKTMRKNDRGEPIYALYQIDQKNRKKELVEGVSDMKIKYYSSNHNQIIEINPDDIRVDTKIIGMLFTVTFESLNSFFLKKTEYMYVSI